MTSGLGRQTSVGGRNSSWLEAAVVGAVAGVVATAAMTVVAAALFERLPRQQRYPLPPRELTERVMRSFPGDGTENESSVRAATLLSHTAFGAAAGAVFAPLASRSTGKAAVGGVVYALAVWSGSYLGWIPGMRLLRPATRHPRHRNALMISVHVIWGAVLGATTASLFRSSSPLSGGPLRDRPARQAPTPASRRW